MTRVATLARQSQGSEDSISLELQREQTTARATELGDDDPHRVDLGVHTGFSIFVKHEDQERIDSNDQVLDLLDQLAEGEFDYLVAHDDTRIARDQFYWVLVWHAKRGGCEVEFIEDVPSDDLTFRVSRVVEAEMKRKEIEKARAAKDRRREQGMYEGASRSDCSSTIAESTSFETPTSGRRSWRSSNYSRTGTRTRRSSRPSTASRRQARLRS